jgi:hypothetical protein
MTGMLRLFAPVSVRYACTVSDSHAHITVHDRYVETPSSCIRKVCLLSFRLTAHIYLRNMYNRGSRFLDFLNLQLPITEFGLANEF